MTRSNLHDSEQVFEPFIPSPKCVVEEKLKFAGLQEGHTLVDLGSGDGRVLIIAAEKFGAKLCKGYEIQKELVLLSKVNARKCSRYQAIEIIHGDMFDADLSEVDLVNVYLQKKTIEKIQLNLIENIPKTAKVVSQTFEIPGLKKIDEKIVYTKDKYIDFLHLYTPI